MPRYETDPPRLPTNQERYDFVIEAGFASLGQPPQWYVIGNGDPYYKCVAWTLGLKYAPFPETPGDTLPIDQVDAFYQQGCGYQKVNVPANNTFQLYDVLAYGPDMNNVAHVAVYLDVPGVGPTWTSKMGVAQLITHTWMQLVPGPYGTNFPAYYTHGGTMPPLPPEDGESFEQTAQRLLRQYGLDRL